jgi:hypothetical protein
MATDRTEDKIKKLLKDNPPARKFVPYCYLSEEADALTVYFEGDADYSERLNDHITLYRSLETKEVVGCRIKGISGILADLPNYIRVRGGDGNIELSLLFLAYRGAADRDVANALNDLANAASERNLSLQTSA